MWSLIICHKIGELLIAGRPIEFQEKRKRNPSIDLSVTDPDSSTNQVEILCCIQLQVGSRRCTHTLCRMRKHVTTRKVFNCTYTFGYRVADWAKEMMELAFKKLEREYIWSGASLDDLQFVRAVFSAAEDHGSAVRIIARPWHGLRGATSNESTVHDTGWQVRARMSPPRSVSLFFSFPFLNFGVRFLKRQQR